MKENFKETSFYQHEYLVYDIELINKKLAIKIYLSGTKKEVKQGKMETIRTYEHLRTFYSSDLPKDIEILKSKGYMDANKFFHEDFLSQVVSNKMLLTYKLMLLGHHNKILEKAYDIKIIDGMNYIVTYISYVNMNTGVEYVMPLGILGKFDEKMVRILEDKGYKYISDTELMNHLNKLSKPFVLKRKLD